MKQPQMVWIQDSVLSPADQSEIPIYSVGISCRMCPANFVVAAYNPALLDGLSALLELNWKDLHRACTSE